VESDRRNCETALELNGDCQQESEFESNNSRDKHPANREQACKPNSVLRFQIWNFSSESSNSRSEISSLRSQLWNRSGDHSSSPIVADWIQRPTRKLRASSPDNASLFGLAPRGVCLAACVATRAGALLH